MKKFLILAAAFEAVTGAAHAEAFFDQARVLGTLSQSNRSAIALSAHSSGSDVDPA